MQPKTVATIALCFFSFALGAQNKHDTVPMPTRTDTVHKVDSTMRSADTTKMSTFVMGKLNSEGIAENTSVLSHKNFFTSDENEVTVSAK